jgi:hypothetical protein
VGGIPVILISLGGTPVICRINKYSFITIKFAFDAMAKDMFIDFSEVTIII